VRRQELFPLRAVRTAIESYLLGKIRHKRERHPGQHEPILERELWEQAQQRLRAGAFRDRDPTTHAPSSSLTGKVFDEAGEPLYAQGAANSRRRDSYFLSRSLVRGAQTAHGSSLSVAQGGHERADFALV